MRIYTVELTLPDGSHYVRLVRARNVRRAKAHVTRSLLDAWVTTQNELIAMRDVAIETDELEETETEETEA